MELIYSTRNPSKYQPEWIHDEWPLCCLSPKNIIAFTSNDPPESTGSGDKDSVYYVYVCDVDKPWDRYLISTNVECITSLLWDSSGTKLLIATAMGKLQIWTMSVTSYLLNEWTCIHSAQVEGEEIVAVSWLHTGMKNNFMADNKDSVLYSDKIVRAKFMPSLCHFGGKATEGIILVVASGLVYVGIPKNNQVEMTLKSESLSAWRSRLMVADITHYMNGDILVAASDGQVASAIQCYRVCLKAEPGSCSIECKPVSSLYPKCHMDYNLRESLTSRVTHLTFMPTEGGEVLVVGAGNTLSSHVELWHLTTHTVQLHPFYQAGSSDNAPSLSKWVHKSSITHTSMPVAIATPRLPVVYNAAEPVGGLFQYVAIAYRDGSVKLISRWTFQRLSTTNLDVGPVESSSSGIKRKRLVPYLVSMQQSATGCVLLGLDQQGSLHMMRAVNTRDPLTSVSPTFLVDLLEYGILVGNDWWDIMATLKPGLIETVIQKLSDNFLKQPSSVQELLYARFMAVKSWLYRCSTAGQQRAADCHCQIMLHSLATAFKSMLRPKAMARQDISPAERLSTQCNQNSESDLDKLVSMLCGDRQEYIVDNATLMALPRLVQWVCELALVLIAQLPLLLAHSDFPGAGLVHDAGALSMLREMMVLIRAWGRTFPPIRPALTATVPGLDPLPLVFRLLTRVWMIRRESGPIDSDDNLIDDCCALPSKLVIPPADQGMFGDLAYDTSIFFQAQPLNYTFGDTPRHTQPTRAVVMPDGQSLPQQRKDIVRQVALGVAPTETIRLCTRCSCVSLLRGLSQVPALRAWDLRWARACPCGGPWKVVRPQRDSSRTRGLSVLLS